MKKPEMWRWKFRGASRHFQLWMLISCCYEDAMWSISKWYAVRKNRKIANSAPNAEHLRRLAGIKRDGEK